MGAHAFNQFACAQCHGDRGVGGVSPDVPALQSIAPNLTVAQLTSIIEHGAGVSSNPDPPVHADLARHHRKAADLRTGRLHEGWLPAGSGRHAAARAPTRETPSLGKRCTSGTAASTATARTALGGVPNPQSPDTVIPPLVGKDFHSQFSDKDIAQIIRTGSVIGKAPIVSMPHWGTILTDKQIAQLSPTSPHSASKPPRSQQPPRLLCGIRRLHSDPASDPKQRRRTMTSAASCRPWCLRPGAACRMRRCECS